MHRYKFLTRRVCFLSARRRRRRERTAEPRAGLPSPSPSVCQKLKCGRKRLRLAEPHLSILLSGSISGSGSINGLNSSLPPNDIVFFTFGQGNRLLSAILAVRHFQICTPAVAAQNGTFEFCLCEGISTGRVRNVDFAQRALCRARVGEGRARFGRHLFPPTPLLIRSR